MVKSTNAFQVVPNRFMSWGNVNRPNKRGRFRPNRHWDPQWKKERADRIVKIPLPQYEVERRLQKSVDPAARKEHLKKMGRMPVNPEQEYATYITSSREAFDNYIPSEEETKSTRFVRFSEKCRFVLKIRFFSGYKKRLMIP